MTDDAPLPSRPRRVELLLLLGGAVVVAGWLGGSALCTAVERADHAAALERARLSGDLDGLSEAQRFAARDDLVAAHLATLSAWIAQTSEGAEAPRARTLAEAVEGLVESRRADDAEVAHALAELRAILDEREHAEGLLDPELALVRDLLGSSDSEGDTP